MYIYVFRIPDFNSDSRMSVYSFLSLSIIDVKALKEKEKEKKEMQNKTNGTNTSLQKSHILTIMMEFHRIVDNFMERLFKIKAFMSKSIAEILSKIKQ